MSLKAVTCILLLAAASPAVAQTSAPDPVRAGYLRFYEGDREGALAHFSALHARDRESLPAWFGVLFAQSTLLELDKTVARSFDASIEAFLAHAERRHARSGADTEALFYLAQGYFLRGTYRFTQKKGIWGAARDAAKSKGYGDQYIQQHPEHGDAYLTLGLYNYYVSIAPNYVKVLRVLLFLPSGNRAEGLRQIERAAREGNVLAPLADVALASIYAGPEGRLGEALAIGERVVQRFPANAVSRMELAEMYAHPSVEAYDRAAAQYLAAIEGATGSSPEALSERYRATFGLANLRRTEWRLDDAIALFSTLIDRPIDRPEWVRPNALLNRANVRALLNDPAAAEDARRVIADPKMAEFHDAAEQQLEFIASRRASNEAAMYSALIPGNRLAIERRWDEARAAYDRAGAAAPGDWQVRYRIAALDFARGNHHDAARGMDAIVSSTARMPKWVKAWALLHLARTHDLAGRRPEAVKLYNRIVDDYEDEGAAGPARVGLTTPYRGKVS